MGPPPIVGSQYVPMYLLLIARIGLKKKRWRPSSLFLFPLGVRGGRGRERSIVIRLQGVNGHKTAWLKSLGVVQGA